MKLTQAHKLTAMAVLLALSTAACTEKPADTASEPATDPAPAAEPATQTPELASFATFTGSLPTETTNKECALDTVNGQAPAGVTGFEPASSAALGGWLGNGAGKEAHNFHVILKGATQSYSTAIQASVARPDVATSLNAPDLANAGFTLNMSLEGVAAGEYSMYVADPTNPQSSACDMQYTLIVK